VCSAAGGELFEKILDQGAYSEKEARDVFYQMLQAVAYLHRQGIVHRYSVFSVFSHFFKEI
jgi:calcium/calmodulin-dependent protein kinase I